ncbi:MAG: glycine cleavage T C-terminal barrel domain-containing protein, partial [Pseudobdellovibrionaceae bacterium]
FMNLEFMGHPAIVAFTGYTGEKGCEVFIGNYEAPNLWKFLLKEGEKYGVKPCGLGARDTLRTEKKYSLYGNEIDDTTNPYAAGLGWVIKPSAKDFMGRSVIMAQKEKGLTEKLIGFKLMDRGIPRHGYELFDQNQVKCGIVTSGTLSPTLNESIGIAYLRNDLCPEGSRFVVDIRGKKIPAKVVSTPFV